MIDFSNIFFRPRKKAPKKERIKDFLRVKYTTFQSLLAENNRVLSSMADLEEKLSGEYLFDRNYVEDNIALVSDGVLKIIKHINLISDGKYNGLFAIHKEIDKNIKHALRRNVDIPKAELTLPLETLNKEMTVVSGSKMAHLGEIKNRLSLPTPEGFSITTYAFKRFMEHSGLSGMINEHLAALNVNDLKELDAASGKTRDIVKAAEIPDDLGEAVSRAYQELCLKTKKGVHVSVRSSALYEDGEFSFAGQYATFLNVPGHLVLDMYKEVVASLFTTRALFYCKTKGFSVDDLVMSVGVLSMVEARSAGVVYTRDPNDPESGILIVSGAFGLGKSVVDGTESPYSYILSRETGTLLNERKPLQQTMFVSATGGGVEAVGTGSLPKDAACLDAAQLKRLFDYALYMERHYGVPQDIEWATDQNGKIYILQSRPLRMLNYGGGGGSGVPVMIKGRDILIDKGVVACKGIGFGKAFVLREEEALKDFPPGAVLVARHTSTRFVTVMNKAAAIITDVGSATGHMASLSREYGVPTILDAGNATQIIRDGQELTVDAYNCNVYDGRVEELVSYMPKRDSFKDTRLFVTLESALKHIVPLTLVDPESEGFRPEHCKTFHDITRFAHEMAMAEIFKTGKERGGFDDIMSAIAHTEAEDLGYQTSALKAGIPMDAHLLDVDGGLKSSSDKVTPADVTSIPFAAFVKGLTSMRWPEPRAADVKGFLGMIAHTASIPEAELHKIGGKSYAIVSRNYMNFSIRLGYHFSMVEAYAGENMNDNYIKFFFKGGGAAVERRLKRVRLIKEILKRLGFRVKVAEDVIDALLTKYRQNVIEDILETMGKLTAYTKQLDMVMYNDAVADMFIEDFVRDHMKHHPSPL